MTNSPALKLDTRQRLHSALMGGLLFGLLILAGILRPDSSGMGTHQQLGLPPCTTVMLFGIPCPTCGMTTSWSHFTRGEWIASWSANPGGFCLAIVTTITGIWAFVSAASGSYRAWLSGRSTLGVFSVILAITLYDWVLRIF